jgi:penicillin-binding protein 1A
MRRGLELSRNAMTVRLTQMIGLPAVQDITRRLGVYQDPQPYESLVLGAQETTLLALTNAYATIANGGKACTPTLITQVRDRDGNTVWTAPAQPDSVVVSPEADFQLLHLLRGVVERGTATAARSLGPNIIGKTGTTNDSMDTWFIGASPDMVVGVYVGYDTPKTLGKRETGATVALPIFVQIMGSLLQAHPPAKDARYPLPAGIYFARVDPDTGEPVAQGGILEAFRTTQGHWVEEPGAPPRFMPQIPLETSETPSMGTGGLY